jgi:hypothetical protein
MECVSCSVESSMGLMGLGCVDHGDVFGGFASVDERIVERMAEAVSAA